MANNYKSKNKNKNINESDEEKKARLREQRIANLNRNGRIKSMIPTGCVDNSFIRIHTQMVEFIDDYAKKYGYSRTEMLMYCLMALPLYDEELFGKMFERIEPKGKRLFNFRNPQNGVWYDVQSGKWIVVISMKDIIDQRIDMKAYEKGWLLSKYKKEGKAKIKIIDKKYNTYDEAKRDYQFYIKKLAMDISEIDIGLSRQYDSQKNKKKTGKEDDVEYQQDEIMDIIEDGLCMGESDEEKEERLRKRDEDRRDREIKREKERREEEERERKEMGEEEWNERERIRNKFSNKREKKKDISVFKFREKDSNLDDILSYEKFMLEETQKNSMGANEEENPVKEPGLVTQVRREFFGDERSVEDKIREDKKRREMSERNKRVNMKGVALTDEELILCGRSIDTDDLDEPDVRNTNIKDISYMMYDRSSIDGWDEISKNHTNELDDMEKTIRTYDPLKVKKSKITSDPFDKYIDKNSVKM